MPESFPSPPEARCSALDKFIRNTSAPGTCTTQCHRRNTSSTDITCGCLSPAKADGDSLKAVFTRKGRDAHPPFPSPINNGDSLTKSERNARARSPNANQGQKSKGNREGSSTYYGVRFRKDLKKYVAEIRVAEWKVVDKKVWLGTYDTQEAAARGVDLARKLLKCKKVKPCNLPCAKLDAYSGQIPPDLDLTDLASSTMFKEVTNFIKAACQAYAASFQLPPAPPTLLNPALPQSDAVSNLTLDSHSDLDFDFDAATDIQSSPPASLTPTPNYDGDISVNDYMLEFYSFDLFSPHLAITPTSSSSPHHSCITQERYEDLEGPSASVLRSTASSLTVPHPHPPPPHLADDMELDPARHDWSALHMQGQAWPGPASAPAFSPDSQFGLTPYMPFIDHGNLSMSMDFDPNWLVPDGNNSFHYNPNWSMDS